MKLHPIGILCIAILLCLTMAVPAFAADPVVSSTTCPTPDPPPPVSPVPVVTPKPTTSVSVVVVSPGDIDAGVALTGDNVNLGVGVNANTSNITVDGKSTTSFNITGGNAATINLNNSNLQEYIGQAVSGPRKGAGIYEGSWQESTDKIRNQVYPAVNQLNTNLNMTASATAKLIQKDQLNTEDIKTIKDNVAIMQADSVSMQEAIKFLATSSGDIQDQVQDVVDNQTLLNTQQAATISILQAQLVLVTNKVQVLEQAKYAQEHSGIAYNLKVLSGNITAALTPILTRMKVLVEIPRVSLLGNPVE